MSDREAFLGVELNAFYELMREEASAKSFVACAHHHRTAVGTAIFADQLILVEGRDIGVTTTARLGHCRSAPLRHNDVNEFFLD
jgi:hypothetical protein